MGYLLSPVYYGKGGGARTTGGGAATSYVPTEVLVKRPLPFTFCQPYQLEVEKREQEDRVLVQEHVKERIQQTACRQLSYAPHELVWADPPIIDSVTGQGQALGPADGTEFQGPPVGVVSPRRPGEGVAWAGL